MKKWILAAMALALLPTPFEEASARGGRSGRSGGGSVRSAARSSRRSSSKNRKKMVERLHEQNRDAVLADAARDRR